MAAMLTALSPAFAYAQPVTAGTCGSKVVRAMGSPALLESAARSKARGAWIRRVRASHKWGPDYAAWLRARQPSYACRRAGKHITCEASAIPCKV